MLAVDVEPVGTGQIGTLSLKAHPVVKPRLRIVAFSSHVPFADKGSLVSGLLQILRKEDGSRGNGVVVVNHSMPMRVKPGENGGPAGRAQRRGDKRILQMHTVSRHGIHLRCFEKRMPAENPWRRSGGRRQG